MKLSVCIPTHDMQHAPKFLVRSLNALARQSEQDFEVVISDNSFGDTLFEIADGYDLHIRYFHNPIRGMAVNINAAIKLAKGDIIKLLFLDDYLAHDKALEVMLANFTEGWLATACDHDDGTRRWYTHYPSWHDGILSGENTIGSPSVIIFENNDPPLFDENMSWLLDCDYYHRLNERYGPPKLIEDVCVVIGTGGHQTTYQLSSEDKQAEHEYLATKYT